MSSESDSPAPDTPAWRRGFAVTAVVLSVLALLTPFSRGEVFGRNGLLLAAAAALETVHGFRRSTRRGQWSAWFGGAVTLGMAMLLLNARYFAGSAILMALGAWFGFDGLRFLAGAIGRKGEKAAQLWTLAGLGNLLACAALLLAPTESMIWATAVAAAARIFGTAVNIVLSPVFAPDDSGDRIVSDLGLPDAPEMREIADRIGREESARTAVDRGWVIGFIATLFAIHVGRMGFDRTFLGVMSPGVAVLGDLAVALLLALLVVMPCGGAWRRLTRRPARWLWGWCLAAPAGRRGWGRRACQFVLARRLRASIRSFRARCSLRSAASRALQIGLPLAAVLAATVPMWGVSWYFDTENWAAGVWNSWAEHRTDTWRAAMVESLREEEGDKGPTRAFAVHPPGAAGDFSFLVIGDTGEGDASQHVLRAQWLDVVRRPEVKFAVVSSDVIYPTGAMRHYEANFWLPFMGTTKPVYAIPGNHDWYDALEGFAATFLEPAAARTAMRARVESDNRITSTTDRHIERLIAQASRLRGLYRVPTQLQKAPFFQFQADRFALFAVDTGVARTVDPTQLAWLRDGLAAAKDKLKMVILGHPLYAGGRYTAEPDSQFAAVHALLREHQVDIVMAGDTHDLEYYADRGEGAAKTMHHVVNGGGGAYLSFGTSLAWPAKPATRTWAFYPSKRDVVEKIETTTPLWKRPAWWWTKRAGAWPFSPEWLSAAFDVNEAPFYQSFVEVVVEPSKGRVRLVPYGIHGRLTWGEMQTSADAIPSGATPSSLAEWIVPM